MCGYVRVCVSVCGAELSDQPSVDNGLKHRAAGPRLYCGGRGGCKHVNPPLTRPEDGDRDSLWVAEGGLPWWMAESGPPCLSPQCPFPCCVASAHSTATIHRLQPPQSLLVNLCTVPSSCLLHYSRHRLLCCCCCCWWWSCSVC